MEISENKGRYGVEYRVVFNPGRGAAGEDLNTLVRWFRNSKPVERGRLVLVFGAVAKEFSWNNRGELLAYFQAVLATWQLLYAYVETPPRKYRFVGPVPENLNLLLGDDGEPSEPNKH